MSETCWCGDSGCGCKRYTAEVERLRAQNIEAAAFLDRLAHRLDEGINLHLPEAAADCRAMAGKLRPAPARDR